MRGGDEMTSRLVVAGNMYIAGASLYTSLTSENYGLYRSRDLCVHDMYVGLWLWKAAKQLQKDEIKGLYLYRKIHKEPLCMITVFLCVNNLLSSLYRLHTTKPAGDNALHRCTVMNKLYHLLILLRARRTLALY